MSRTQVRKKGFSFLSFFLGFLFAILVIAGSIAGAVIFALNTDLDALLSTFGVDNSKDEEGNNKVVNTDPENGGVTNVMELLTAVSAFATDYQNKTIADVEVLLPLATGLVDSVYEMLNQYVEIDKEEIKAVKFSEFGSYLTEVVYDIEPASFFDTSSSPLVDALLRGVDAEYVEVSGTKYPVWYDDSDVYFYCAGENYYVVNESEGVYTATGTSYTYNENTAHCTGNFYYANGDTSGDRISVSPITIRSFVEGGDFLEPLNKIKITEFIGGEEGGLVTKVLGGISVGDLIGGNVNFDEKINTLKIRDFVEVDGNKILEAIGDSTLADIPERMETITIGELVDTEGNNILEAIKNCTLEEVPDTINGLTIGELVDVGDNKILKAIEDCTFSNIADRIETLRIGELVDIPADNKILKALENCTLAQVPDRINELTIGELIDVPVDNKILSAISGCTLEEVPDKVNELEIGDLLEVGDNKILKAIENCTLSQVPSTIDTLTVKDVIDVDESDKLMWALKDAQITNLGDAVNGLYVNDLYAERGEDGKLTSMWKMLLCEKKDGEYVEKKYTLNNFGDLVGNITENMQNATLYELDEAGILTFENKKTLDKTINGNKLGSYTITGALEALTAHIPE